MYKKTIKYVDFDGKEQEETFYFHLTQTELTELSVSKKGGLEEYIKAIVNAKDYKSILETFEEIILMAYGEKVDGKKFVKKRNGVRLAEEFEATAAYDALITELSSDEKKAAEFFNKLIPQNLAEKLDNAA